MGWRRTLVALGEVFLDGRAFADHLVAEEVIGRAAADRALREVFTAGCRLDSLLLLHGAATEDRLLDSLGRFMKSRPVTAGELAHIPQSVTRLIPKRAAERFRIVPFRLDGRTLSIATLDPTDLLVEDEVRLLTSCAVTSFVALEVRLYEALALLYGIAVPPVVGSLLNRLKKQTPARPRPAAAATERQGARPTAAPEKPAPAAPSPRRSAAAPDRLELSEEELGMFPTIAELAGRTPGELPAAAPAAAKATSTPSTPEDRLDAASVALQHVELRDEIADVLFEFCRPLMRRRALFTVRQAAIVGWRGEGEGVEETALRAISVPVGEPSVFHPLLHGTEFWLGPIPPMPRNIELTLGLGGAKPTDCLILPITLRSRVVAFLYGDNLADGVRQVPLGLVRRLAAKAGLAFEAYILRNKIRSL